MSIPLIRLFKWLIARRRSKVKALVLTAVVSCGSSAQVPSQQAIVVETHDHATIYVDVVRPEGKPKALVVVAPGTGGLADPYFDAEVAKAHYDAKRRGLTRALANAGFATAFLGQRGYAQLGSCMANSPGTARAAAFLAHCVDQRVRATVDLNSNAEDIRAAIVRISAEPDLIGLPLVVIAFSESLRHVAWLTEANRIDPVIVVGVGGASDSLEKAMKFQFRREWALNLAEMGLDRCNSYELPLDRLAACAGWPNRQVNGRLQEALGSDKATAAGIKRRRELWDQSFESYAATVRNSSPNATISGSIFGVEYPAGWSIRFYQQILLDDQSAPQRLARWSGSLLLIYGEMDSLVRVPGASEIDELRRRRSGPTELLRLPGVGHALEAANGEPPEETLGTLVGRVDDLLKRSVRAMGSVRR